ncbi:MAG TPA: histidine--tRNA ligase, partial [Thermoplasmatales archaeon]|nr:histidine--tRNA ligase [Thermoplasmatales archaeon]
MIQRPRGTQDFLPSQMVRRRYVEEIMRVTFKSFGYSEVQTPTFEHLELFTAKSGEGIIEELYAFKDKGGRDLALRPELTAPVIRLYVEKLQMEPKPLKLFYFGNCFRYDRPQRGRYREFMQAGCELIGCDSPAALAELIAVAWNILRNVGLKNIVLRVGNLDFVSKVLDVLDIKAEIRKKLFPFIDKKQFSELEVFMKEEGFSETQISDLLDFLNCKSVDEIKKFVDDDLVESFEEMLSFLPMFGVNDYVVDTSIVRGLDYYKGVVFEVESPTLGAEKQLCGGGAYDLIPLFGGKQVSTAGFAIGFDRTVVALENQGYRFPEERLKAYVVPVDVDSLPYA